MAITITFNAQPAIKDYDVLVGVPYAIPSHSIPAGQLWVRAGQRKITKGPGVHLVLAKPKTSTSISVTPGLRFSLFWFVVGPERTRFTLQISGVQSIEHNQPLIQGRIAIGEGLSAGHRYFSSL